MKTKFAFMLLCLYMISFHFVLSNDVKWISSHYHASDITKLSNSGDYYLIFNDINENIRVLNSRNGNLISSIKSDYDEENGKFINFELSADEKQVYEFKEKQVKFWDIRTVKLVKSYNLVENGNEYKFVHIVKPKNEDFFTGIGYNINEPNQYKVITWSIDSFMIQHTFNVNTGDYKIQSLDISPNGLFICINSYNGSDYSSQIYNLNEGQLVKEFNGNIYSTKLTDNDFVFFSKPSYFISKISLYNLYDFSSFRDIPCSESEYWYSNRFDISRDNKYLLFINPNIDNQLDVYNIENHNVEYSFNGHFCNLDCFRFLNEDTVIIENRENKYLPIIELIKGKTNSYIRQLVNGHSKINGFCFSDDNKYLWVLYEFGIISKYEIETGILIKNLFFDYSGTSSVLIMSLDKTNELIACAFYDDEIFIINTEDNSTAILYNKNSRFSSIEFSSDSKTLISTSHTDSLLIIWDLENNSIKKSIKIDNNICYSFYSSDENFVYVIAKEDDYYNADLYMINLSNYEITTKPLFGFIPYKIYWSISDNKQYISTVNSVYDLFNDEIYPFTINRSIFENSISSSGNYIALVDNGAEKDDIMFTVLNWQTDKVFKNYNIFDEVAISEEIKKYDQLAERLKFSPDNKYLASSIDYYGSFALFKFDTTSSAVEEYLEINTYEAKVFPNPSSNIVNLDLSLPSSGVVNVTIRDVQGVAVIENYSEYFTSGKANIPFNLPKLSSGMYYVTVSFNTETTTIPLIIIN